MKFRNLATAILISLAVSACGDDETAQSYLEKAKTHLAANKINDSIIELKNGLRLEPKNAEIRFILGKTYLLEGRGADAVKELERALSLKYMPEQVIPILARAYMLVEADDDILALSDESTVLTDETQTQYLAYKTIAALRLKQPEVAKDSVMLARSLANSGTYLWLAESYLSFSERNFNQASDFLVKILADDPEQPDALMLQGKVAVALEDYPRASKSFEAYLAIQPYSGIAQLLLGDSLLKEGNTEKAEQYADAILAKVTRQPFANYLKAMARFAASDYQKASEHAEIALQGNFNQFNLKLVAGASAFQLKNYEQSHHHLSALIDYLPQEHIARRMLAVSQLQLGLVSDISETLNEFESISTDDAQFLSSLSFKLLELGAVSEAQQIMTKSTKLEQGDAEQSAREGLLKLMMNDPSGMDNLKEAIKLDPDLIEAELALAFAAVQSGDMVQARSISAKWQEKYPDKPGSFNLLAAIYLQEGQLEQAKSALVQSLAIQKDNLFALTAMVRAEILQGNLDEAKILSVKLLALHPHNLKVLRQYFELHQDASGLVPLEQAYNKEKSSIMHGVLYAEALWSQGKTVQAIAILKEQTPSAKTPKKYWHLLLGTTKTLKAQDKTQRVLESWRSTNPYHLEPVILLADFFATKREYSRAISIVNSGLEQHERHLALRMVKMQLLLNSQRLQEAKTFFQQLKDTDFDDNIRTGIQGRIYLLEKNYPMAIPALETFYRAFPNSQTIGYLSGALQADNQALKATTLLESYLAENENKSGNDRVRALLASFYLDGQQEKALTTYELIAKTQPDNFMINNNLAWLYLQKGQLDIALSHAEKAYKAAPKVPNVVDTYSQVLLKQGNKRLALETAEKAYNLSKGKDTDIMLNYIEVLIANSRKNEAKKLLAKTDTSNGEQSKKKSFLLNQL